MGCFLDKDLIIHLKNRITNPVMDVDILQPILLPADNQFVSLWIYGTHLCMKHTGLLDVLLELREHFWLIRGHQQVKKILGTCFCCKKLKVALASPPAASLPLD